MPIDLPTGYLTRPEASKKYNRSQRALERDLDVALTIQDRELLSQWKLVTKEGVVRDGKDVTVEMVKKLVAEGMAPAWCIAESFLEEKYGRKGSPRPSVLAQQPSESITDEPTREAKSSRPQHARNEPPEETAFLKTIIRNLEREKEQERQRHDQIVVKLFQQLDVKDKQISAWDEVTQGLTKALATGQITPNIDRFLTTARTAQSAPDDDGEKITVEATPVSPAQEGSGRPQNNPPRTKSKPTPAKRKARSDKEPAHSSQSTKPKWNEFPTLKKLFSRR